MRLLLSPAFVLLTALAMLLAGVPAGTSATDGNVDQGSVKQQTAAKDTGDPCSGSPEEEREEEVPDSKLLACVEDMPCVGLTVHRFTLAHAAATARPPRFARPLLPVRGPPSA
jgi:hypothetical protein